MHKVLNFGMKHDCEIVIIGVAEKSEREPEVLFD